MEFQFEPGVLDAFYEQELGLSLAERLAKPEILDATIAAKEIAEWEYKGIGGPEVSESDIRFQMQVFLCCGVVLESVLLIDELRQALTRVHQAPVKIGSIHAGCYHELVHRDARMRIVHIECENDACLAETRGKYGRAPKNFTELRTTGFRWFSGFYANPYQDMSLFEVWAHLEREADLAVGELDSRAAPGASQTPPLAVDGMPTSHSSAPKKMKPKPNTYAVIAQIRAGKSNDEIMEKLGMAVAKSVSNIDKIRSYLKSDRYEI